MIEDYKNLQKKNILDVDSNLLFPLMRWNSGSILNLSLCKEVNRMFFFVDKKILTGYLGYNLKPSGFIKYPKAKKFDDKKLNLISELYQKKYNYGKNDLEILKPILINKIKDKNKLLEIAENFGLDNNQRKLLGLQQLKFDKSKMKKNEQVGLF